MEAFERKLMELFDFNRFEPHPEMVELIDGFEKRRLARDIGTNKREPISFRQLEGADAGTNRATRPSSGEPTKKKDKGKPL